MCVWQNSSPDDLELYQWSRKLILFKGFGSTFHPIMKHNLHADAQRFEIDVQKSLHRIVRYCAIRYLYMSLSPYGGVNLTTIISGRRETCLGYLPWLDKTWQNAQKHVYPHVRGTDTPSTAMQLNRGQCTSKLPDLRVQYSTCHLTH